jgi:hypothetical protein
VRRVERRRDLTEDPDGPPGLERTFAPEQPGQVFALDEAHVDEQPVVDLAERWMGMMCCSRRPGRDPRLTLEAAR